MFGSQKEMAQLRVDRMKAKGGNKYTIVATERKLAIIYFKMVRYKKDFNPVDMKQFQEKYKAAKIAYLERKLVQLSLTELYRRLESH